MRVRTVRYPLIIRTRREFFGGITFRVVPYSLRLGKEWMVIITIVCACGQHNIIPDERLESAVCSACGTALLRPAALKAQSAASSDLRIERQAS